MSRLSLVNMMLGFIVLSVAAAAGAFISTDITNGYLKDQALLETWQLLLSKSAHGHTNLFGILHIALGLTLPYSIWSMRVKLWQTIGLALGTTAMGPLMVARAYIGPTDGIDANTLAIGIMLSCALATLVSHAAGLAGKLMRS